MEQKLLNVNHLSVSYGNHSVLRDVGFSLGCGEFAALLGLNGSGKTTLLRTICGLKKADSGGCFAAMKDIFRAHEKQRAHLISYIPQRHSIVYDISVTDVVLMGFNGRLRFYQQPGKEQIQRAFSTMEKLGIYTLRAESFLRLSEGQKQLVILARSMVQDTPVMLLDEPDSALDFVNRHKVLFKIREIIHEDGRCGLITLHDPNFALQYCDRLLLLSEGNICGEVNVKSNASDIKNNLSKIYGRIELLKYKGGYAMVKG
ncbi:MAG TPA: ABC transporter ATP-binding protein [Ruminiclostridium sp.]|nr:ABC transporter ATP-binding protein [Ruminiclostridium sp.]